jgi:FMN-dependent oxidoreductase (nitrilotriacetate monooxygenase family)
MRRFVLATFIHNSGAHPGGWRYEPTGPVDQQDFQLYARLAHIAERGKLHAYFSGDSQGYLHIKGRDAFAASDWAGKLEPTTLLAALAAVTHDIGLIATVSTSYNEPYSVARRFASIDHISGGRAGWNVVTSTSESEARNFGRDAHFAHADRYERAEEFVDIVKSLWDSWEDGAQIRDRRAARYFDPDRVHALFHKGRYFSVAGPLNTGRPPQGHPIVVQAGGSEAGRQLAARTADLIFTAQNSLASAKKFYADMKRRAVAFGRNPAHLLVIPSVQLLVRSTEAEAKRAAEELLDLVSPAFTVSKLGALLGADLSAVELDAPLPDLPLSNGDQWVQQQIIAMGREEGLTVRQLARRAVVSRASFALAGTPESIADMCETWFREEAADGLSLSPDYLPTSLEQFVDQVVPVLQRRGLFRTDYEGATLRENLGLPRPPNRFVENPGLGGEPDIWA